MNRMLLASSLVAFALLGSARAQVPPVEWTHYGGNAASQKVLAARSDQ